MKKFTIALLLSFLTFSLSAQYVSVEGTALNWNDPATWEGGQVPNLGNGAPQNLRTVTIPFGSEVLLDGIINSQANLELYVSGGLEINGLNANANLFIEVAETGLFVVNGSITYKNNTSILVNGQMLAESILVSTTGTNATGCIGGEGSLRSSDGDTAPLVSENIMIPCASMNNPFPVIELDSFSLTEETELVALTWETSLEENGAFFTIQRSTDLVKWLPVGSTVEAAGSLSLYAFDDMFPVEGFALYRLRLTDENGKFSFSEDNLEANWTSEDLKFKVVKNHSFWTINMPVSGQYLIEAYSIQGRRILAGQVEQSLTMPAPDGAVVIRVTNNNARSASRVVM